MESTFSPGCSIVEATQASFQLVNCSVLDCTVAIIIQEAQRSQEIHMSKEKQFQNYFKQVCGHPLEHPLQHLSLAASDFEQLSD